MNRVTEAEMGRTLAWIVIVLVLAPMSAGAASYQITWSSVNSGGGSASGGPYRLDCSIGQSAAGFAGSQSLLHWIGFWAGEVPQPVVVPTIASAKLLPDGEFVSIAGRIATASSSDFGGFFYIEDEDRSSGMRIGLPGAVAGLARGSVVNVIGTMGTTDAGERQLTGPVVVIVGSHSPLKPLGMPNRSLGGGTLGVPPLGQYGVTDGLGLNNVGLLVSVWGRVVGASGSYRLIDDGSGVQTWVDVSRLGNPPAVDDYVSVIGVSSLYKPASDRLRLVLPRDDNDIAP